MKRSRMQTAALLTVFAKLLGVSLLMAMMPALSAASSTPGSSSHNDNYADLEKSVVDNVDPVAVGEEVSYTASVYNHGPAPATNVRLYTRLTKEVRFVSASYPDGSGGGGGCARNSDTQAIDCVLDELGVNEKATIELSVKPVHPGHLSLIFESWADNGPEITLEVSEHTTVFEKPYMKRCTIFGTERSDQFDTAIHGTPGDDVICPLDGYDYVYGGDGNDVIYGDDGYDYLYGGTGNDIIYGGLGNDNIFGGPGRDRLFGERGADFIQARDGVKGNDFVVGGSGRDFISYNRRDRVRH